MTVEMHTFSMRKEEGIVKGRFQLLKYKNTQVLYKIHNGCVFFEFPNWCFDHTGNKYDELYQEWYRNEKNEYEMFVLNYLKAIKKLDEMETFKGEIFIEKTFQTRKSDPRLYDIVIEFEHLLKSAMFSFSPMLNSYGIKTKLNIPINSQGDLLTCALKLGDFVKKETLQRIWDPFRSKTKYRLELLHMLR